MSIKMAIHGAIIIAVIGWIVGPTLIDPKLEIVEVSIDQMMFVFGSVVVF